jgi:hypothetical protein
MYNKWHHIDSHFEEFGICIIRIDGICALSNAGVEQPAAIVSLNAISAKQLLYETCHLPIDI